MLKILEDGELKANDLLDFFLSGMLDYRFKHDKKTYAALKRGSWERRVDLNARRANAEERRRFNTMIYRLHSQGLIAKDEKRSNSIISITKKGIEKSGMLGKGAKPNKELAYAHRTPRKYKKIRSASSILVSFDIPEKEKGKRDWLRNVLRNLDFKLLHQSTWIGSNALPEDFLEDCRKMRMIKYLHIFSVIKKGTIGEQSS